MTLKVSFDALSLDAADAAVFREDARVVFMVLGRIRARLGTPASRVHAVLSGDFATSVERHYRPWPGEEPRPGWYNPDRQAGRAVAKVLQQTQDLSAATIVFDEATWRGAASDGVQRSAATGTLAHEFAHVVIDRARHASGAMDGVVIPSVTGHEHARSLARILAGEYRADAVEDVVHEAVLNAMGATVNGGPVPDGVTWLRGREDYIAAAATVLDAAHPGWPDLVDEYRNWRIPLEEMFMGLRQSMEIVLTILTHAQAHADTASSGSILGLPELASKPATGLYLGPFEDYLAVVRSWPPIVRQRDVLKMERAVVDAGERAVLDIWRRMGLTPEPGLGRTWSLRVDEPAR